MLWVCSSVLAQRPDDELIGLRWPLEYVGVVSVETSLRLNNAHPSIRHADLIVMPFSSAYELISTDEATPLKIR